MLMSHSPLALLRPNDLPYPRLWWPERSQQFETFGQVHQCRSQVMCRMNGPREPIFEDVLYVVITNIGRIVGWPHQRYLHRGPVGVKLRQRGLARHNHAARWRVLLEPPARCEILLPIGRMP